MSYNISSFHLKELDNFMIPLSALTNLGDFEVSLIIVGNQVRLSGFTEGDQMVGSFAINPKDQSVWLAMSDMHYSSEFSGGAHSQLCEDVYPHCKGYMKAMLVWEGGDSIEVFEVKDGKMKSSEVEV